MRKLNRPDEALAAYQNLSQFTAAAVNGSPADLVARRARCAVFEERARKEELHREAASLAADLRAGRWQLDHASCAQVSSELSRWLDASFELSPADKTLAGGVEWLYRKWNESIRGRPDWSGMELLANESVTVTVLWTVQGDHLSAFLAGGSYLHSHWVNLLRQSAQTAQVSLLAPGGKTIAGEPMPANEPKVQRSAADAGLPWSVAVAGAEAASAEFAARRRILFAGLAAVLILVVAGSYFI